MPWEATTLCSRQRSVTPMRRDRLGFCGQRGAWGSALLCCHQWRRVYPQVSCTHADLNLTCRAWPAVLP